MRYVTRKKKNESRVILPPRPKSNTPMLNLLLTSPSGLFKQSFRYAGTAKSATIGLTNCPWAAGTMSVTDIMNLM